MLAAPGRLLLYGYATQDAAQLCQLRPFAKPGAADDEKGGDDRAACMVWVMHRSITRFCTEGISPTDESAMKHMTLDEAMGDRLIAVLPIGRM